MGGGKTLVGVGMVVIVMVRGGVMVATNRESDCSSYHLDEDGGLR